MTEPDECPEECGGNGYIDCWNCDGDGAAEVTDDEMTICEEECNVCNGLGCWECPVCEAREE